MSNWTQLSPSTTFNLAMGQAYGMTDVGLVRDSNEDNFLIDPQLGLVMIGDGMGGHEAGEIASADALLAVRDFLANLGEQARRDLANAGAAPSGPVSYDPDATWSDQSMPAVMTLFEAVEFANAQVYAKNLAQGNGDGHGMGTTLTGFWQSYAGGPLVVFHVGDCRLYRYRDGELSLLTRDQTLYQQALEEGLLEHLPPRNMLLQAIGPSPEVRPEVKPYTLQAKDLYLLCSDGLHGSVPHGVIAELMGKTDADHLDQCCAALIAASMEHGSRDNITAVLMAAS